MKIHAMFQGGGARVLDMLITARALRELHDEDGPVQVLSASGVSAGAVAAAALAFPDTAEEADETFKNLLKPDSAFFDYLAEGTAFVTKLKEQQIGKQRITYRASIDLFFKAKQALGGKTLLSAERLEQCLADVFKGNKVSSCVSPAFNVQSDELQEPHDIELRVYAANLNDAERIRISQDEEIFRAIRRSAALPFIFSSHRSQADIEGVARCVTDGGIVGDLAVRELLTDRNLRNRTDEKILAITFEPEELPTETAVDYAFSLLDASLAANKHEMERLIDEVGGIIHPLKPSVLPFDFDKALRNLRNFHTPADDNNPQGETKLDVAVRAEKSRLKREIDRRSARGLELNIIRSKAVRRDDITPIYDHLETCFPVEWKQRIHTYIHRDLVQYDDATVIPNEDGIPKTQDVRIYSGLVHSLGEHVMVAFRVGLHYGFDIQRAATQVKVFRRGQPETVSCYYTDGYGELEGHPNLIFFLESPRQIGAEVPLKVEIVVWEDAYEDIQIGETPPATEEEFICQAISCGKIADFRYRFVLPAHKKFDAKCLFEDEKRVEFTSGKASIDRDENLQNSLKEDFMDEDKCTSAAFFEYKTMFPVVVATPESVANSEAALKLTWLS